eukprot:CAMPEP_0195581302 /NCGR_PEP_ID=MMETSP0814-20130614/19948_1 /TAXON_ID=97485 /ORGANISM="Prymnesium parvum, Strain Texoma1" /LENGTH=57 /DNA_ID=CAMNT_0040718633 /DNA_START=18 /DNA_END=187 /DNA_ORIENTATION=-
MESDRNLPNDQAASSHDTSAPARKLGKAPMQHDDMKNNKQFKADTTEHMENKEEEQA